MSVLAREPFEFVALNEMTDAVSLSWPVQWWYRRLIANKPAHLLTHLHELTRQPIDPDALRTLPENTLGRRYVTFCDTNGITSDGHATSVPQLRETFTRDWVTHRFFKIHDILHVVTGFGADVPSEMGLQMFDACNLREPYGIGAVLSMPYMVLHYGQPLGMLRRHRARCPDLSNRSEPLLRPVRGHVGLGPERGARTSGYRR